LWQVSIVHHTPQGGPVPLLRWSATKWRQAEAVRDRIMRGVGTDEPWIMEHFAAEGGIAVHWRRPLRLDEVNRMGPTAEVLARPGRG
jgi:hypothetical protein